MCACECIFILKSVHLNVPSQSMCENAFAICFKSIHTIDSSSSSSNNSNNKHIFPYPLLTVLTLIFFPIFFSLFFLSVFFLFVCTVFIWLLVEHTQWRLIFVKSYHMFAFCYSCSPSISISFSPTSLLCMLILPFSLKFTVIDCRMSYVRIDWFSFFVKKETLESIKNSWLESCR